MVQICNSFVYALSGRRCARAREWRKVWSRRPAIRDKNNGPERTFRATALEWVNPMLAHAGEVNGQYPQHLAKNRLTSGKDGRAPMPMRSARGVCALTSVVLKKSFGLPLASFPGKKGKACI